MLYYNNDKPLIVMLYYVSVMCTNVVNRQQKLHTKQT